ncbi:MAG: hypothetical protein ACRC10_08195 [Thermoguttaceae bacterium]
MAYTPNNHHRSRPAFTLLELLVGLSLFVVLVSMIWSLLELYTNYYLLGTRRAERSQLVRSLSQLLTEDLGAAIQDPVHPTVQSAENDASVRRFGLSGDATSLRIDVVQINPLNVAQWGDSPIGSTSPNRFRSAVSGPVPFAGPQVPELKTVFYDFISLAQIPSQPNLKWGLSRKELDFETPTEPVQVTGQSGNVAEVFEEDQPFAVARSVGTGTIQQSFAATDRNDPNSANPDFPNPSFQDSSGFPTGSNPLLSGSSNALASPGSSNSSLPNQGGTNLAQNFKNETDLGIMWAPEVVDCRFRYSDGNGWTDSWDSLAQNGLPVAIEVVLQIMPLEDVEKLRTSPLLLTLENREREKPQEAADSEDVFATARSVGTATVTQNFERQEKQPGRTLAQVTDELGLSPPVEQRILLYLPTSPHIKSTAYQRPTVPVQPSPLRTSGTPPLISAEPALEAAPLILPRPQLTPSPKKTTDRQQEWIRKGP